MKARGGVCPPGNGRDRPVSSHLGGGGLTADSLLIGLVGRVSQDTEGCPLIYPSPTLQA